MIVEDKYLWTKRQMPLVYELARELPIVDRKLLISLPLTWETLCLIDAVRKKIQPIVVPLSSGHHSSLQPGVFHYLERWGIRYFREAKKENRVLALREKPDIILDCMFETCKLGMKRRLIPKQTFLIEDTRTGAVRLREILAERGFENPYFILDDSTYKREYENRFGIGYSVVGALAASGILLKGKVVTIVGFGPVGQGLAEFCRGLGAKVSVVEIDRRRNWLAKQIYKTGNLIGLLPSTDILLTATGIRGVVDAKDLTQLKDGAILVNAGADWGEWDQDFLHRFRSTHLTEMATEYSLGKKKRLIEMGGGNSFNLAAGVSVSSFLDVTFALGVLAVGQFLENKSPTSGLMKLESGVATRFDERVRERVF